MMSTATMTVRCACSARRWRSTARLRWRGANSATALDNGAYSVAAQDSAFERGARYAERLPDRERGLVLGAYFASRNRDVAEGDRVLRVRVRGRLEQHTRPQIS